MQPPSPRFFLLAILAFCLTPATITLAQVPSHNPDISLFENGQGSILFPGGSPITLTGVLGADPGPGGQPLALTFDLLGPPALIAGDLFLTEGATNSDLIRFNPAGTGGNPLYPASVLFYSLPDGDDLADVTFPAGLYTNVFSLPENLSGATTYTPTANQPGFVPGFAVTYLITSTVPVPVPDSGPGVLLFSLALAAVAGARRWQRARLT